MCALIRCWLCIALLTRREWECARALTFCHAPSIGLAEQSVNEVEDPLRAQSGWRRGFQCVKGWACSTHAGSGLCGSGRGVVECHRHPCVPFGVDQAVLYYWHCLWTSGGRWKFLGEQDGAVVGVFLPLPSGPASSPLSVLNAHFRL